MIPVRSENEKSYHLALKFLKYRPRSRAEMRHYLKGKSFSDNTIQQTIRRLESAGLLDDLEFSRRWVENRRRFKPKGHYALKAELKNKGIEEQLIELILNADDEEKNARSALRSKINRWQHLDDETIKKKAFAFLRSRGFPFKICLELSERISEASETIESDLS